MKNRLALLCLLGAWALAACTPSPFQLDDISGSAMGRDFALTDHTGRARTLADFRGKAVLLFFGFTHCPDFCPTTLADMAGIMRDLGPDAARTQFLFVTLDPERDTQAVLARFVPSFDPRFIGLYGDVPATERTAQEFKVVYQKHPLAGGDYTLDHSVGLFIYDPAGRLRLFARYGQPAAKIEHDVRLLLGGA